MRSSLRTPPRLVTNLLLATTLGAPAFAQTPVATRWLITGNAVSDFQIVVDSTVAHSGRASLRISADVEPAGFASVATALPASAYAGQRVTVSAVFRTASLGGQGAALWARADSGGRSIAFATTQGHRYLGGMLGWTSVSVDLDVPAGAASIALGALSAGSGHLWVDDVRIERVSAGPDTGNTARALGFELQDTLVPSVPASASARPHSQGPREAPRPVTARGLDNLVEFARLVGYVRFWHPSDSVLTTNWDEFTVRGMRAVERAPTADSLVATLRGLFAGVAPSVAVYRAGHAPAVPSHTTDPSPDLGVNFWEHCGYGVPTGAPGAGANNGYGYKSTRRRVAAPNGVAPAEIAVTDCGPQRALPVPDPSQPFIADLGGGVAASIPLAFFTTTITESSFWHPQPATERFSLDDRATRLADVALLWMVPQHFYPYFDVVHTDWADALRRALSAAATDRGAASFDSTLQRLVAALHDGHGNVVRSGLVQASPDVAFGWVEDRVVVTAAGDSATAAGVRAGDEVVAIDGRLMGELLRDTEARTSGATPQWTRRVALNKIALGVPGTIAVLRLGDPLVHGAASRDVQVARVVGPLPTEPRPARIAELRPGILYVDLGRVTDADMASAMPQLERARGIVFDMRGYPRQVNTATLLSHLTDSTIRSARFELPLVVRPDHADMRFVDVGWTLAPQRPRLRANVAFVTGGGAISYAESTMGVVEENHLAPIVGEATAGTNGNINPFELPGGYRVYWTGLRVRKRDGTPHHGVGIRPTIPASPTLRGVRAGEDEVLARAIEIVSAP